jgi:hypothetical protein
MVRSQLGIRRVSMKPLLAVLFVCFPVIAQQNQRESYWDKENDDAAIAYFRNAEQGPSYEGFLSQEDFSPSCETKMFGLKITHQHRTNYF